MDNDQKLAVVLGRIPRDADRLIVLYPAGAYGEKTAIGYFGLTPAQLAETLYAIADEIVGKAVDARPPISLRGKP